MGRGYGGTVLWGTRYKIEKITEFISQRGEAGNRTVNDCGGIIWRDAGAKRELAGAARATRPRGGPPTQDQLQDQLREARLTFGDPDIGNQFEKCILQ